MVRFLLLTSTMAMAAIGAASAASEGLETDSITDISFSKQVEGAIEHAQKGGEIEQEEMEDAASNSIDNDEPSASSKDSDQGSNSSDSPSPGSGSSAEARKFEQGFCDPDSTAEEDEEICEDIWETICNPFDEVQATDDLCDWLGFTADVVWYEGKDPEYKLEYVKLGKGKLSHKKSKGLRIAGGMCDPDKTRPRDEDVCVEVWESLCNPYDEFEVDDEFCDWIGFTADVEWVYPEDYLAHGSFDSYSSDDRPRKNLRGRRK
jgi:hypothetical protein